MASTGSKRKRSDILEILADLERRLPSIKADTVATAALAEDVGRRIKATSEAGSSVFSDEDAAEAHKAGVQLWNLVLCLERESERTVTGVITAVAKASRTAPPTPLTPQYKHLLLCSRVFAFVIIHNSICPEISPADDTATSDALAQEMHLLDIALRAARSCIDREDVELGRIVLDKAALYRQHLKPAVAARDDADTEKRETKFRQLDNIYIVLQLTQLWREKRAQDAERLYIESQATNPRDTYDPETLEELASALSSIGKLLLAGNDFITAITWLDRASDCLPHGSPESMSPETRELCIATINSLAIASLGTQTSDGHKRAQELTTRLKEIIGGDKDDRRVQLIQLELFASPLSETFDANGYADVLIQMIKSFTSSLQPSNSTSNAEFQLLHHHIQKLHNKSPGLGCSVLDEFMLALRHKENATEWIEKLIITRVWLLVHQRETQEELDLAQSILSKLRMPIGADTAAAAQTLIWKRIEQGYQERHYATAIRWCRLALCHIFEASGRTNRPLIERKLLLCCIESCDLQAAKSVYVNMAEATRDQPMTKYLLYKVAIKSNDTSMAAECLRSISMSAEKKELLHACVLHAKHAKAPQFMVQALKKLADSINYNDANEVNTPALFRCIILMLRDIINSNIGSNDDDLGDKEAASKPAGGTSRYPEEAIGDLCEVFKGAVDAIEADRNSHATAEDHLYNIDELEWLCRAAYNIGLKYSGTWDLRYTVCILDTCVKITNLFSAGQDLHIATDLTSKRLACHFLIASALAALVRRPSKPGAKDQTLKDCHAMREHIHAFHVELRQLGKAATNGTATQSSELVNKLSVLLAFDFEAAILLGDWDELESICETAAGCQNPDTLRVLGDSLLRSQAHVPSKKFVSTMRLIVSKINEASAFNSEKLVKYYRCLFQAALYRDNDSAFQVLEEVGRLLQAGIGSKVSEAQTPVDWPEEELQFLAAVAFNEGIDWFVGGREDQARQWVRSAAKLADQCHDGGKLKGLICARFLLLNIGELEVKQSIESDLVPHDDSAIDVHIPPTVAD